MSEIIKKVLIANRSEISIRIAQTLEKMKIESVCIYSETDKNMPHVRFSDKAIEMKGATNQETYLNINQIIEIAKEEKVDAIHPGYGFLSEKSEFAKKVEEAGIKFIGPSWISIEKMGDKINSKLIAKENKIPLIPGFIGKVKNNKHLIEIANEIGYPVMIKASSGGGGKGMRIVNQESEIIELFEIVKQEALNNYKDDNVFIEKYIQEPRHIEVQILGDKHGNIVALGERECSIQRFNQKIIEESPSVFVDEELRQKLYNAAKKLAKGVNYYSAGTVEFIVDKDKNFYFLEMNTRLQVEHRVTEFVNNKIDLVELMIEIANNKPLPFKQEDINITGHSIECRICAEDPSKNFLPSTGKISYYYQPENKYNEDFIIDTGIESGSIITSNYDSMICKAITYGETREIAVNKMIKVLNEFEIEGVKTNIELIHSIIKNENFLAGNTTTAFIKNEYKNGFRVSEINNENSFGFLTAIAIAYLSEKKAYLSYSQDKKEDKSKFLKDYQNLCAIFNENEYKFFLVNFDETSLEFIHSENIFKVKYIYKKGDRKIYFFYNNKEFIIQIKKINNIFHIKNRDSAVTGFIIKDEFSNLVKILPKTEKIKINKILSPLSGKIKNIKIKEGQLVEIGQPLFNIEAMKMENQITSDYNCKIKKINIKEFDIVKSGSCLIEFDLM